MTTSVGKQILEACVKQASDLGLEFHHCEMSGIPNAQYALLIDDINYTMFVIPDVAHFASLYQDTTQRHKDFNQFMAVIHILTRRYQVCKFIKPRASTRG